MNVGSDGDDVTECGRLFHVRVAATGKARSPTVNRRVVRTKRAQVDAERRRRHASRSEIGWGSLASVRWHGHQTVKTQEDEYSELIGQMTASITDRLISVIYVNHR